MFPKMMLTLAHHSGSLLLPHPLSFLFVFSFSFCPRKCIRPDRPVVIAYNASAAIGNWRGGGPPTGRRYGNAESFVKSTCGVWEFPTDIYYSCLSIRVPPLSMFFFLFVLGRWVEKRESREAYVYVEKARRKKKKKNIERMTGDLRPRERE